MSPPLQHDIKCAACKVICKSCTISFFNVVAAPSQLRAPRGAHSPTQQTPRPRAQSPAGTPPETPAQFLRLEQVPLRLFCVMQGEGATGRGGGPKPKPSRGKTAKQEHRHSQQ